MHVRMKASGVASAVGVLYPDPSLLPGVYCRLLGSCSDAGVNWLLICDTYRGLKGCSDFQLFC